MSIVAHSPKKTGSQTAISQKNIDTDPTRVHPIEEQNMETSSTSLFTMSLPTVSESITAEVITTPSTTSSSATLETQAYPTVSQTESNVVTRAEFNSIIEQFSHQMSTLRAENLSLHEQLNIARTRNFIPVSTPIYSNPPISVGNSSQLLTTSSNANRTSLTSPTSQNQFSAVPIPSMPHSSSQINIASNTSAVLTPSSYLSSDVNSAIHSTATASYSQSSSTNVVTTPITCSTVNSSYSGVPSIAQLPIISQPISNLSLGLEQQSNQQTTVSSPLQQWLQTNSYHSLVGQNDGSNRSYQNQQLHPLPQFSGNPEQWPLFYSSFKETTRDFGYSNLQNTLRLDKSLTMRAREAVESLLINPNNVEHIINTLEFMFGRPELLMNSQLEKIRSLNEVLDHQVQEFIDFSIKIQNFTYYLETIRNSQHHLCNPTLISEIVNKMPLSKRTEWTRVSLSFVPYPTIRHLANWLNNEAQLLSLVNSNRSCIEKGRINAIINDPKDINDHQNTIEPSARRRTELKPCELCIKKHGHSNNDKPHFLFNCPVFKEKTIDERWEIVKGQGVCFSCLKDGHGIGKCFWKRICGIRDCKKVHSRFLHSDNQAVHSDNHAVGSNIENSQICNCNNYNNGSKLFFKIIPIKIHGKNRIVDEFAFIDEGSNTSLIDLELLSELELPVQNSNQLEVKWFNGSSTSENSYKLDLCISPCQNSDVTYTLSNIKTVKKLDLEMQTIDVSSLPRKYDSIRHLPICYKNAKPRLLIGLKHASLIFPKKTIEVDELAVAECKLGWYVYGKLDVYEEETDKTVIMSIREQQFDEEIAEMARKYFEYDDSEADKQLCEQRSLELLQKTTQNISGVFQTGLLWKYDNLQMPNNFSVALKRLRHIEDKMSQDSIFALKYEQNLMDYVKKGYARKLHKDEINLDDDRIWYLPHFAVFNPNKPEKFRIVFDAASKFRGVSLNACLMKGPDLNQTLLKVLFNFRVGKFAVCGDIKEMFPQVKIIPEDQNAQRFLWRHGKKENQIDQYVMTSMIFGAACSPTSAQYVKNMNAKIYEQQYPEAVRAIIENHYVDDYVASFPTLKDAVRITKEVIEIHKKANFELRKFISNSSDLLKDIGETRTALDFEEKVLGLWWNVSLDVFKFRIPFERFPNEVIEEKVLPTKRQVLQIVMTIFDPFGFLNNYTVLGRLIVQELWDFKLNWDDIIPEVLSKKWKKWLKGLKLVENIKIPRYISMNSNKMNSIQIHIFTDASDKIFSAVAYLRVKNEKSVDISILISKVRVASRKKIVSIPRMELQGAVLGVKVQNIICENLSFVKKENFIFWCDSKVVLCWINNEDVNRFKPYVNHRIKTIQESSNMNQWRYVPSSQNVADDSTKYKTNMLPSNESRWIKGPEFLQDDEKHWPQDSNNFDIEQEILEEKTKVHNICIIQKKLECLIDVSKYSSYRKVFRIMAWVFKAKNIFLKRNLPSSSLSYEEFQESKVYLVKIVQCDSFHKEIENLKKEIPIDKESNIRRLYPFLDNTGVLRVKGRLENAIFLKYSTRHPIILPKDHYFTTLIIRQFHEDLFHQNKKLVLNEIRMHYWIADLKRQLEKLYSKCVFCQIRNARIEQPRMSPLPIERITPFVRPFSYSGLDYCGHFLVRSEKKIVKVWIALFTCMSTRAIHLEVVNNLKSSNCLLAITNFINRRGIPVQLRTDNAGYFLRSKKLLSDVIRLEDIEANVAKYNIKWVTNTPESPHMGGAWERLIGCVKRVLEVTIKNQILNLEVFNSLVLEAENIVNSRPLTNIDLTEESEPVLTPNNFLLGTASTFQSQVENVTSLNLPKQFRILNQIKHSLWVQWIKEYLPELTKRSKWYTDSKPIQLNNLVLICDGKKDYHNWTRGKVVKLYPGTDGQVRTVDVQTIRGILKRPVNRLAVLNISNEDVGLENVEN